MTEPTEYLVPTEPGFYWWHGPEPQGRWQVVEVIDDVWGLWVLATGVSAGYAVDVGQWGPRLEPPE